LLRRR
jgi:hypothetical protein